MPTIPTAEEVGAAARREKRITLARLAAFINESFPHLEARMVMTSYRGDRRPKGCRYITSPGKERDGKKLVVNDRAKQGKFGYTRGSIVKEHDPLHPYRSNDEVARWVIEQLEAQKVGFVCQVCGEKHPALEKRDGKLVCSMFCRPEEQASERIE